MSEYALIQKDSLTAMGDVMRSAYGEDKLYTINEVIENLHPISSDNSDICLAQYIEGNYSFTDIPTTTTMIPDRMFKECDSITELVFPEGLISIGTEAFKKCVNLKRVVFPKTLVYIGIDAFSSCHNLTEIVFNNGLSPLTIDECAFYGCDSLTNIIFPKNLANINYYSFGSCDNLTKIVFQKDSLTNIGLYAFRGCQNLSECIFPKNSILSIGAMGFYDCYGIQELILPEGLTHIGKSALPGSTVKRVVLPSTLITLDDDKNMPQFHWSNSQLVIDVAQPEGKIKGAPWGATNATINYDYVREDEDEIEDNGFDNIEVVIKKNTLTSISDIIRYYLNDDKIISISQFPVKMIDVFNIGNVFANFLSKRIQYFTIPDGVLSINNAALQNHDELIEVTIPISVTSIDSYAFYGCENLITINVPWAEGEIANAPWGATNAVINYNYIGE